MPRASTAMASAVYCGASSSSEGKGSICVGSAVESRPTKTAPESVRYATKSPAVATSVAKVRQPSPSMRSTAAAAAASRVSGGPSTSSQGLPLSRTRSR